MERYFAIPLCGNEKTIDYSKSIVCINKFFAGDNWNTTHFGMTLDELVNFKGKVPTEEKIEDKTVMEQLKLINVLDEEDKAMVFRLIDTIVTKKKFKDFVATVQ